MGDLAIVRPEPRRFVTLAFQDAAGVGLHGIELLVGVILEEFLAAFEFEHAEV